MTSLIVDTSVALKWLNQDNEQNIDHADKILEDARDGKVEILAPELLKYEIGNALLYGKKIAKKDIKELLSIFYSLPISFVAENTELGNSSYILAKDLGITYYDASFISLAERSGAILVTENIKHQGKTKKIKTVCLKDYEKRV